MDSFLREKLGEKYKLYFVNTSWVFFEKIFRLLVNVFVSAWVARYLGTEAFGSLNYSLSFAKVIAAVSLLGLDQVVVRELVRSPEKKDEIISSAFVLKLIGAGISLIIIPIFPSLFQISEVEYWMIYLISLGVVFQSFGVIDFYFQSIVLSKYVTYAQSAQIIGGASAKLALIYFDAELYWFAFIYTFELIIQSVFLLIFLKKRKDLIRLKSVSIEKLKFLVMSSVPIFISTILMAVYSRVDQIYIGDHLGNSVNGLYAVAVRIAESSYFIPIAICGSLFPSIVKSKVESTLLYKKRISYLAVLLVFISLIIILVTNLSSKLVVPLLFGSEFQESALILNSYIWMILVYSLCVFWDKLDVNEGKGRGILVRNLLITACCAASLPLMESQFSREGLYAAMPIGVLVGLMLSLAVRRLPKPVLYFLKN